MTSLGYLGLMIALLFVYMMNLHREFNKRIEKLEKNEAGRLTSPPHQR
jgi:hypothetical protein